MAEGVCVGDEVVIELLEEGGDEGVAANGDAEDAKAVGHFAAGVGCDGEAEGVSDCGGCS